MSTRRSKAAPAPASGSSAPAGQSQSAAAARLFSSAAALAAEQAKADMDLDTAQQQVLSDLLAGSGFYLDFSRGVHNKAANLLQLLRAEPPYRMPFSATQLLMMYAQLLGACVRATPNKALAKKSESTRSGSQLLDELDAFGPMEERPELDDEQPAAPWSVRDVAACVELLQATQMRLEEALNAEAGATATTSVNGAATAAAASAPASAARPKKTGATSAAPAAAAAASSSSMSADDVVHVENDRIHLVWPLKRVLLGHAKSIVHLMLSHFCRPEYWGSVDAASEAAMEPMHDVQPETTNRIQFFAACMQMLVSLLPSVLGQLAAKESARVMDWLTRIVKHEVERAVRKHERQRKSTSAMSASTAAVATPAVAAAAAAPSPSDSLLVRSTLPCCIACSLLSYSPPRRSSFPYGSLSPSGSLAISALAHAHHLQGLDADNAAFFRLPTLLATPAMQLTFLAHIAHPLIRLHAVSVAMANLFNRSRTMLYTGKNAEGLRCFSASAARDALSHELLQPQLEFVSQWLDSLVDAYAHAAESERGNLTTAVRNLRFAEETAAVWAPVGPATETRKHKQATAAAAEERSSASSAAAEPSAKKAKTQKEGNVKAMFARQSLAQSAADERSKRTAEENRRLDEADKAQKASSAKQARRQEILTKRDAASHAFRELQALYAHLLALLVQSVAELMHEHCNEQHRMEQADNLRRSAEAEAAALSPHSDSYSPCIPDSQPLTQASSADPAEPSSSQYSLDADDPDEPSASQTSAASRATAASGANGSPSKKRKGAATPAASVAAASPSPSKHKKKPVPLPPLPCQCAMIDVCDTLKTIYAQVHSKLHAMQAAILTVAL